jgi:membrane-associated phospholipid phosphatase
VTRTSGRTTLTSGVLAVLAAALFGISLIAIAGHRGPNRLDRWGDRLARHRFDPAGAHAVVQLGSPLVVGSMLVLLSLIGFHTPLRARALVVTAGGALTCVLTDHMLQRVVPRYGAFGYVDAYPSGHVTGVTVVGLCALALVALQRPTRWALALALLVAVVGTGLMTWAVVSLRAHYFTDAIGAVLVSVAGVAAAATVAAAVTANAGASNAAAANHAVVDRVSGAVPLTNWLEPGSLRDRPRVDNPDPTLQ